MNDFVAALGTRLEELSETTTAAAPAGRAAAPVRHRRRLPSGSRRRWSPIGGALSAAGVLATTTAVLVTLASTDEAQLPVFGTPASDASALRGTQGFPAGSGLDLRQARAFATPGGTGYVVPSTSGPSAVCIALPDADTGSYGSGCAPLAKAERDGELAALSGERSTIAAFLLPVGGRGPVTLVEGRRRRAVPVQSGVAVVQVERRATLEYRAPGGVRTRSVPGPFKGPLRINCEGRRSPLKVTDEMLADVNAGRISFDQLCLIRR